MEVVERRRWRKVSTSGRGFHHAQKHRAFSGLSLGSCFNPDGERDPAEEKISTLLNQELDRSSSSGRFLIRNSRDFESEIIVSKGFSRLKNLEGLPSFLNVSGRRKRLSETDRRRNPAAVNEEPYDEETKRVVFVWDDLDEPSLCIGSRVSSRWSPQKQHVDVSGRHSFDDDDDDQPLLDSHFRDIKVDPVSTLRSHRTVSKSLDFGGGKCNNGSYSPPPLRKDRLLLEPGYFPGGPVDLKPASSHGKEKDSFRDEAKETGNATTKPSRFKMLKMPKSRCNDQRSSSLSSGTCNVDFQRPSRGSKWIRYLSPRMMDKRCDSSERWELTNRFRELEIVDCEMPNGEKKFKRLGSVDKTRIGSDVLGMSSSSCGWKVHKSHRTSSRSRSRKSRRKATLNESSHPGVRSSMLSKFKLVPTPYASRKKVYRPSEIDEVTNSSALFELKMEANVKDFFKQKRTVIAVRNPVSSSSRRNHPMPSLESDNNELVIGDDHEDSCNQDMAEGRVPPSTTSPETSRDVENVEINVKPKLVGHPEVSGIFPSKEQVISLLSKDLSLKCEGWEYSYILKVLSQSGIEESSPNCPLNPSLFDNIEKKYGEEMVRLRSERMLIFDCINSAITEASGHQQHVDAAAWGDSKRETDAIGREIETSVTDALVNEFVSEWKRSPSSVRGFIGS